MGNYTDDFNKVICACSNSDFNNKYSGSKNISLEDIFSS